MTESTQDPAVTPLDGSDRWFESGPEPILTGQDTAVLMIRVGMAVNANLAHTEAYLLVLN